MNDYPTREMTHYDISNNIFSCRGAKLTTIADKMKYLRGDDSSGMRDMFRTSSVSVHINKATSVRRPAIVSPESAMSSFLRALAPGYRR